MPKITASAPVLLVRDVITAARYYARAVGFVPEDLYPGFCILHRDGHYLMLAEVGGSIKLTPFWKIRDKTCNAYFWVDDADALYAEMKAAGARMDYAPCTQPYGVREFGIQDLDEHDIAFGQVLRT